MKLGAIAIVYTDLRDRTLAGGTDEEILAWVYARGIPRSDEECRMWSQLHSIAAQ